MSDNNNQLWGSSKEGMLKACDEACGYRKNRKCNVNKTNNGKNVKWNSGVKDEMRKK